MRRCSEAIPASEDARPARRMGTACSITHAFNVVFAKLCNDLCHCCRNNTSNTRLLLSQTSTHVHLLPGHVDNRPAQRPRLHCHSALSIVHIHHPPPDSLYSTPRTPAFASDPPPPAQSAARTSLPHLTSTEQKTPRPRGTETTPACVCVPSLGQNPSALVAFRVNSASALRLPGSRHPNAAQGLAEPRQKSEPRRRTTGVLFSGGSRSRNSIKLSNVQVSYTLA